MTKARAKAATPEGAEDAAPGPAAASPSPQEAGWQHVRETGTDRGVRAAGLTIALILFAVAAIIALYSAMRIASIWFEPRWVPVVQLLVAAGVMAACFAVLRRLKR